MDLVRLFDSCCFTREKNRDSYLTLIDVATSSHIENQDRRSMFNILLSEGIVKGYYPYSHLCYYIEMGASMEVVLLASVENSSLFKALVTMYRVDIETLNAVINESIVKGKIPSLDILRYFTRMRGANRCDASGRIEDTFSEKALVTILTKSDTNTARFLLDLFREECRNIRIHARDLDRILGKDTLARAVYREDTAHLFSKHRKDIRDMIVRYL